MFFYKFCWIRSQNWLIIARAHPLTSSSSSLSEANSHLGGAGSLSQSRTPPNTEPCMDIRAILDKSHDKEGTSAASTKKPIAKKD